MSLLPQSILPASHLIGRVDENGNVLLEQNWWLLIYNLCQNVLGLGAGGTSGLSQAALIDLASLDSDADDADAIVLRQPIANSSVTVQEPEIDAFALRLPLSNALLLAQEPTLADPPPLAQPSSVISVGGSPFTYTAPFAGSVVITGGTVTSISFIRQGTSVATGLTSGIVPVSRYDQVQVAYMSLPTMTFIPWSSQ